MTVHTQKSTGDEQVPISFRIDRNLAEDLQKVAEHHDRTLSAELRRAVRQYLEAAMTGGGA